MSEELEKIFEDLSLVDVNKPPDYVMGQIYIVTCKTTSMSYIGKTKTHRRDGNKWRIHGFEKRWVDHLSEAINNVKENQCTYLNNAIRKYGKDDWDIILIHECELDILNAQESLFIKERNTLTPGGYNLTGGGDGGVNISIEQRSRISATVTEYWKQDGVAAMYSAAQLGKNDLEKLEKLKYHIDNIKSCNIILQNYMRKYDIIILKFYNHLQKPIYFSGKNNKIRYGGAHITIDDALKRVIHLLNSLGKELTITILDEDLKTKYNSFKQDISIAGTSLTQSKD